MCLKTPKAVIHHEFIDTPDGLVYWVPRVSASVLPVARIVYDSLDKCIEMYRKYASEADVWLNTLNPKKNDRRVRSSNFRVCGCKARVLFDMVPYTTKYTLTTFDVEHNHELDRVDYKHLSKVERKLTYNDQIFIIKAANANVGVMRAHKLNTGLKGSSLLVHGTQTEFKNFTCGVNYFIRDSDAQMLITSMEDMQEFTKDLLLTISLRMLSFVVYFGLMKLRSETTWSLVISYKMVFVPFTAIDNHKRSVTIGSGLLKKETAKTYGWLLRAFKKAFIHASNIVVTYQDGAMRLAVAAEFPESNIGFACGISCRRSHPRLCLEFMMTLISRINLSYLLEEQLLEPALNWTVHCCGREFLVLNCYDQKSLLVHQIKIP
uniref:MULE transposase domain-containing protein n=1 Tax=Tanacetum cinerariifolium TaxID=118510 RepID=A0A6L2MRJ2_TANCI|nr:hypothetical protein [Tanacetum cinerariifolium]